VRVAALDLGTNTFLLLIAEVGAAQGSSESYGIQSVLHDEMKVVRLGQDVAKTLSFHPDALTRAKFCLSEYAKTIAKYKPEKILACATSAARDVANKSALIDIAKELGIPLQIISGDREAELTFRGTWKRTASNGRAMIIDVGGGSTEFILGGNDGIIARQSLDIGSVRLTERFVSSHPIKANEMESIARKISLEMQRLRPEILNAKVERLIAVAGTPTTLAAIEQGQEFEASRIDGQLLSNKSLHAWVKTLAEMTVEKRQALIGMEPKRADVIVAGTMILAQASDAFDRKDFQVSTRGLRYGIALALLAGESTDATGVVETVKKMVLK
jgi:exopolyphosphatase/guanosine-5'-triphosphate,3'-diphosphate pyrophosphatase